MLTLNRWQVVGRLAAYKGVPLLTGLGDVITHERQAYTTLIRTSYDLRDEARAILAFMAHHNWYHFGLIFRYQDIYYSALAFQLLGLLRNKPKYKDFVCTCRESYVRDNNKRIVTNLDYIMRNMRACTRSMKLKNDWCVDIHYFMLHFSHCNNWWREGCAQHDVNCSLFQYDFWKLRFHLHRALRG